MKQRTIYQLIYLDKDTLQSEPCEAYSTRMAAEEKLAQLMKDATMDSYSFSINAVDLYEEQG